MKKWSDSEGRIKNHNFVGLKIKFKERLDIDGDREAKINLNGFQYRIGIRIKI